LDKYLRARVKTSTEKAVLLIPIEYEGERGRIVSCGHEDEIWFPLSQIDIDTNADEVEADIPEWLMREKGLI